MANSVPQATPLDYDDDPERFRTNVRAVEVYGLTGDVHEEVARRLATEHYRGCVRAQRHRVLVCTGSRRCRTLGRTEICTHSSWSDAGDRAECGFDRANSLHSSHSTRDGARKSIEAVSIRERCRYLTIRKTSVPAGLST